MTTRPETNERTVRARYPKAIAKPSASPSGRSFYIVWSNDTFRGEAIGRGQTREDAWGNAAMNLSPGADDPDPMDLGRSALDWVVRTDKN